MINFAAHQARAGPAGAREDFEQMLGLLVRATEGDASLVFPNPGDWGIDVLVGDLHGQVTVWQAKYFVHGVTHRQKSQITESFDSALKAAAAHGYTVERWMLCIPASMDGPTTQWWQAWKAEQERDSGVIIELWDENGLREMLLRPEAANVRRHFYNPYRHDGQAAGSETVVLPYQGLSAFGEQDAGLFFGREAAIERVLEVMSASLGGAGLVVVSGVSGAGKSSLLSAGVLPRLREAGLAGTPEAASWPWVALTPGQRPLEELAVRIAPLAHADAAAVRDRLTADPAGFALTARQAALADPAGSAGAPVPGAGQRRVLLVVDQCEQLFTSCQTAAEREAFITALHAAVAGRDEGHAPPAVVVLVIRADFEARLADYPQLITAVQRRYLLTGMTERQLRLAITQPAAKAGSRVEDDLVQVLLNEVQTRAGGPSRPGQPSGTAGAGVLPLLSHALDQTWRTRTGHALTLTDYERTGGIEGAVAASAQRALARLTPAQQKAARQVFTRLVATSSDDADTAVCVARSDLSAGKDPDATKDVDAVVEEFAAARLLVLDADTVEISHEALLTAWPLLRDDWLAGARADRIVRTRLQATAQEWILGSRDPSYLYIGSRLDAAAGAASRIEADPRHTPLSHAEKDFLHASQAVEGRRVRRRQGVTAVLLALLAGLAAVAVAAFNASQTAARQRDAAASDQLVSESQAVSTENATVSRQDSIAAWAIEPSSAPARYAMVKAAANPQIATITDGAGLMGQVAFSPDGKILAVSNSNGAADVWDVATLTRLGTIPDADAIAFSPDGKLLAATGSKGIVRLWKVATRRQVGTLGTPEVSYENSQAPAVFSPDGQTVAVGVDGALELWNVPARREVRSLGKATSPYENVPVAFMPGARILLNYAGVPWLWDVVTNKLSRIPTMFAVPAVTNAQPFSPNGTTLLGVDHDSVLRLWDAATGRDLGALPVENEVDYNDEFAFSPDGRELAIGNSNDGTVRLWDVATREQIGTTIDTEAGGVSGLAFSPDGRTLATSDGDGTVRLWDVATNPQVIRGSNDSHPIAEVAFNPDGKTLTAADALGATRAWDINALKQSSTTPARDVPNLPGVPDLATDQGAEMALSPDGKSLAVGYNGTVRWWDVAANGRPGTLLGSHTFVHYLDSLAFSPDSKTLAIADNYGHVMLWDVATNRQTGAALTIPPCDINSLAFSQDGKMLVGSGNSGIHLWDITTQQLVGSFTGSNGDFSLVALSPDGKIIAAENDINAVELWDVATHKQISGPLVGDSSAASMLAFSPDGQTLAVLAGGTVQLWDMGTDQPIGAALSGGISAMAFSPDGRTLAAGDRDGRVQLWNVGYLTDPLALLCSQIGGSLTLADWAHDVPSGPAYRNVCS
jgi:WD40 repeat protein